MVNTLIQVDEEVWEYLKTKKGIGESFNDILRREFKLKPSKTKKELNTGAKKSTS